MSVRCESSNSSMSFCAYVKYIPPRCPSVRKREWIRQVDGHRFPYSTECYELLSTEAFGARVSDCRPLDYGECALFRKRNLFMHCLPLLLYAFLCSVTLARVCIYIVRIYVVSVFRYICAQTQGGWSP